MTTELTTKLTAAGNISSGAAIAALSEGTTSEMTLMNAFALKTRNALRGISSQDWDNNQRCYTPRTNYHAFADAIKDIYGYFNFCKSYQIPFCDDILLLLDELRYQLDIPLAFQEDVLGKNDINKMLPAVTYTNQGEAGVWLRIREASDDIYQELCPELTKQLVERLIEKFNSRRWNNSSSGEYPGESAANMGVKSNVDAADFRDSLTVGCLKEWAIATQILSPFDRDMLRRINDFISKFSVHGYNLPGRDLRSSRGLTQLSADKLNKFKVLYLEAIERYRERLIIQVPLVLEKLKADDSGTADFAGVRIICPRTDEYFIVPICSGSELSMDSSDEDLSLNSIFTVEDSHVVRSRLPVAIASMIYDFRG